MLRIKSPIPLRWSALKWQLREWNTDRKLRSQEGREHFLNSLKHQSDVLCVTNLLREALQLEGEVIECGVFRGASLLRLAYTMQRANSKKTLFGYDSFDGFPQGSVGSIDVPAGRIRSRVATKFRHVAHVPARIQRLCRTFDFDNVELVAGFFENTLPELPAHRKFCFAHLDVDLFDSYRTCLAYLYDRIVPGGIIVFDEYEERIWPGATKAIDSFFEDKPESPQNLSNFHNPRTFIRKLHGGQEDVAA